MITLAAPLLHKLLDRIDAGLAYGAIELTLPDGRQRQLGGRAPGPVALVHIRTSRPLWRLPGRGLRVP